MSKLLVRYGHCVCVKQYTKHLNTKHAVKAEISTKQYRSRTWSNIRHFLSANSVC